MLLYTLNNSQRIFGKQKYDCRELN